MDKNIVPTVFSVGMGNQAISAQNIPLAVIALKWLLNEWPLGAAYNLSLDGEGGSGNISGEN